jgi:hypothetical protein
MWFLVSVVKGSRHFETDSPIDNRVLISDTSETVISGRASYPEGYRFEARVGNETFILCDYPGTHTQGVLVARFLAMAQQMGALTVGSPA